MTEDTTDDSRQFQLPWETLEALIHGISSVDLKTLPFQDREEAALFLRQYGFDETIPEDAAILKGYLREAVQFIEYHLLGHAVVDWDEVHEPQSPAYYIPPHISECSNTVDLLLMAAQGPHPDKRWACSLLKVMHIISHIDNSPVIKFYDIAREQILSLFEQHLTRDDNTGHIYLGDPSSNRKLRLFGYQTKDEKTRESILTKLLSKQGHVAERLQDLLGVRIVTYTPAEVILALDLLRELKVIVFPNIIPSRSRNSLFDLEEFKSLYRRMLQDKAPASWDEIQEHVKSFELHTPKTQFTEHNPLSSNQYRSMHVTCRHLIRIEGEESWQMQRMFYPYEIQLMDRENYIESREGESAHNRYKQRQLIMARRRVLGDLLERPVIPNPDPYL